MVSAGFEVRKIAVGTALLNVTRTRDQALAVVRKMPAAEDVAIQALLGYLYERPVVTPTGPPAGAATAAGTTDAGPIVMMLSPETIAALRPAQTETTPSLTGSEKIVLGKAPTTDGTLKRPEYFAAGDMGDFQRHEATLAALEATTDKNVDNKEFFADVPSAAGDGTLARRGPGLSGGPRTEPLPQRSLGPRRLHLGGGRRSHPERYDFVIKVPRERNAETAGS